MGRHKMKIEVNMDKAECEKALEFLDEDCEIITGTYRQDAEYLFECKLKSIDTLRMLIDEHFGT